MLVFAKFEMNKIFYEKEDIIDRIVRQKVFSKFPNEERIENEEERIYFEKFYYELMLYNMDVFTPEY